MGVSAAVDGVVELLEPPGARLVLLGEHLAVGHLPLEAGGLLQGEHCCVGAEHSQKGAQHGARQHRGVSETQDEHARDVSQLRSQAQLLSQTGSRRARGWPYRDHGRGQHNRSACAGAALAVSQPPPSRSLPCSLHAAASPRSAWSRTPGPSPRRAQARRRRPTGVRRHACSRLPRSLSLSSPPPPDNPRASSRIPSFWYSASSHLPRTRAQGGRKRNVRKNPVESLTKEISVRRSPFRRKRWVRHAPVAHCLQFLCSPHLSRSLVPASRQLPCGVPGALLRDVPRVMCACRRAL